MAADILAAATGRTGFADRVTRSWWAGAGLVAGVSLAYYLSFFRHFIDMVDEGLLVNGGLRVLDGQQPVTEFWAYPPARYLLLAAAFKTLGIHLTSERLLLLALLVLRNALVFLVARRVLPFAAALAVAFTVMLVPGPWHKVFFSLPVFAHLFLLFCYIDRPNLRRAGYCGAVSGLAFYFRQDVGVFGVIVTGFTVIAVWLTGGWDDASAKPRTLRMSALRTLGHGTATVLCVLLVLLPGIVYYASTSDLGLLWSRLGSDPVQATDMIYQKVRLTPIWLLPRLLLGSAGGWMNHRFLNAWFPWTMYFSVGLAVLVGLYTAWRWWWGHLIDAARMVMCATLLAWSALAMFRQVNLPGARTCLIAGQGMVIVIAVLFVTAWTWARAVRESAATPGSLVLPDWPRAVRWLVTVPLAVGVLWFWSLWLLLAVVPVPRVPAGSASSLFEADTPLSLPRAELVLPEAQALALSHVVQEIQQRTGEHQPIFAYRQAMFYFLADRPNPTGFDNILAWVALPHVAREMADVLGQSNPPALQVFDLSESWTVTVVKRYPDYLRSALFTDYQPTYRYNEYLLLEPSPGSDAWQEITARLDTGSSGYDEKSD